MNKESVLNEGTMYLYSDSPSLRVELIRIAARTPESGPDQVIKDAQKILDWINSNPVQL